ncbi:MAG TPA: hydrogenase expression/formation protein HypE [Clostridia bacterium]|nr:hydrogenase expression/formation protein HypE [Clostridia bacterium]
MSVDINDRITLAHGDGGLKSRELVSDLFLKYFTGEPLRALTDSAILAQAEATIAFTTDAFVISPLFFPGGDIGKLSVTGTVNDLAVMGATPRYISASFILEEGFPVSDLKRIVASMAKTAGEAGVEVVTGDTKVVRKGEADGIFIVTSGLGFFRKGRTPLMPSLIRPGDLVLINGYVGDHGVAVLSSREGITLTTPVSSDCMPLSDLIESVLETCPSGSVRCMRDPTRGGLATVVNELAEASNLEIVLDEQSIPIREEVRAACDIFGLDPLYLANEGKVVAVVDSKWAEAAVGAMRSIPGGEEARIIGEVRECTGCGGPGSERCGRTDERSEKGRTDLNRNETALAPARPGKGRALLRLAIGGTRILRTLSGSELPRIC